MCEACRLGCLLAHGALPVAPLQAEVGDPHRDGGYWGTARMVGVGGAGGACQAPSRSKALVAATCCNPPGVAERTAMCAPAGGMPCKVGCLPPAQLT